MVWRGGCTGRITGRPRGTPRCRSCDRGSSRAKKKNTTFALPKSDGWISVRSYNVMEKPLRCRYSYFVWWNLRGFNASCTFDDVTILLRLLCFFVDLHRKKIIKITYCITYLLVIRLFLKGRGGEWLNWSLEKNTGRNVKPSQYFVILKRYNGLTYTDLSCRRTPRENRRRVIRTIVIYHVLISVEKLTYIFFYN